jgi:hypothetical protein
MRTKFILLTLLACLTCHGQKSIDKAHFYSLIQNRKYEQLLVEAHAERNKVYGKIWLVDYYIAKAACGLGKPKNAVEWFNSSMKYPNVNDEIRKFLLTEQGNCGSLQNTNVSLVSTISMPDKILLNPSNIPSSESRGKMGPVYRCNQPPKELTKVHDVSSGEYDSRLFAIENSAEAIRKYKSILNSNYHISVSGRFLLITYGNVVMNEKQIAQTSKKLERTYNYFSSHYGLRPPDKLLAVYLLPDKNVLRQTARLVHGINIPESNIGYSNLRDLSLVGVSDITHIGTLCHELFHLMIRTDVGDAPPWLDEGMACIYETSKWNEDELLGEVQNWRIDVLKQARYEMSEKIPNLPEFLDFTWAQYDGIVANDICTGAINYAYGKHLMLFCQQQGKLPELVTAVKNRIQFINETDAIFQSYADIFEKVFETDLATIEKLFNEWLYKQYNLKLVAAKSESDINSQHIEEPFSNQPVNNQNDPSENNTQVLVQQGLIPEETTGINVQQSVSQSVVVPLNNAANISQQNIISKDANEIVNSISIHVRKDFSDKTGDAVAFYYFVDGENDLLENIEEVNYQRNHSTMKEFKSKSFVKSADKSANFSFKAYQWGTIQSVSIYIMLKDGTQSLTVLKDIVYDN